MLIFSIFIGNPKNSTKITIEDGISEGTYQGSNIKDRTVGQMSFSGDC